MITIINKMFLEVYMIVGLKEKGFNLDPRTLFFVNMVFCIIIFVVNSRTATHLCFTVASCLMLLSGLKETFIKFLMAYLGMFLALTTMTSYDFDALQAMLSLLIYIVGKIIPMLMIGTIIVKKVKVNELMTAFEQMNFPRGIIVGIVVSIRFVPTISHEFSLIKESMKLRGIELSTRNILKAPLRTMEYCLVPVLFRSLKIAEELSAAALTRGVENEGERSAYFEVKMDLVDYMVMGLIVLVPISIFWLEHLWVY